MRTLGIRGSNDADIFVRQRAYGISIDSVVMYQPVHCLCWAGVKALLDEGKGVQLVLEFSDSFSNLVSIASGHYDTMLHVFAAEAARDGRHFTLRPLHELNGDWYSWCVYKPGNSVCNFGPAYKHIVTLFRSHKVNVSFQLCFNWMDPCGQQCNFKALYPGDQYVDEVGFNVYNRVGLDQWHPGSTSLAALISVPYANLASMTSRPLFIGEMSSTSYGGDKPRWIAEAFVALKMQFPRITTVNWFLESKQETNRFGDWDLTTPEQITSWRKGAVTWKE